ncbi:MAG: TIGR00269 family protein [Methanobrevibacter sp.]|jgi:uncharacterized protein (TIGR00269 family)|nr:TIGR00269 family protein [Methanobrevibacter sp.]
MTVLNKESFNKELFSRIRSLITEYNLIKKGDLIAIALSGGKDSVLTLHALAQMQKDSDFVDFDIIAISVDEGIHGYRNHGIETARSNAKELGIELVEKSFKEEFDFNLDDIYTKFKSACIPCGVFRRNILNKTAYEIGADTMATGHNLDDEIQSFLMSFARADTMKFAKFGPKLDTIHPKLIPRIKPLWNTAEKDVGTWAIMNEIAIHLDECPYSSLSLRAKTKNFLNNTESKYPGTKLNILNSFKKMFDIESTNVIPNECEICGEPTSSNVCMACEIIKIINNP